MSRSSQVQVGTRIVAAKTEINSFITASHIAVTFAYSVTQVILIFYKSFSQDLRMYTAFYFFGGLAEIFLSIMLWFILESQK